MRGPTAPSPKAITRSLRPMDSLHAYQAMIRASGLAKDTIAPNLQATSPDCSGFSGPTVRYLVLVLFGSGSRKVAAERVDSQSVGVAVAFNSERELPGRIQRQVLLISRGI
jgi:hypothetical protein